MDFSLTTLFVVPTAQTVLPTGTSTQDLAPGELGFFDPAYLAVADVAAGKYFYVAQGRDNTYLQGSKRSDKIAGCASLETACKNNVTEWYKVTGCGEPLPQITHVCDWSVQCDDVVTVTIRAHSSYLDTLYFNGFTRSVTVPAPCCDCGEDPCADVDIVAFLDTVVEKLNECAGGINPDNICLNQFFEFSVDESGETPCLVIEGKPLTKYGQPCDVAAFPHEYDRMYFNVWVYEGPATTADFIVDDNCDIIAEATVIQNSNYATGTAEEIAQLEKNFHSYQAGYLKHLFRMVGYNNTFQSEVEDGMIYDTYYVKFNELDRSAYQWGDYIQEDATVIIAVPNDAASGGTMSADIQAALETGLGAVVDNNTCIVAPVETTVAPTTIVAP